MSPPQADTMTGAEVANAKELDTTINRGLTDTIRVYYKHVQDRHAAFKRMRHEQEKELDEVKIRGLQRKRAGIAVVLSVLRKLFNICWLFKSDMFISAGVALYFFAWFSNVDILHVEHPGVVAMLAETVISGAILMCGAAACFTVRHQLRERSLQHDQIVECAVFAAVAYAAAFFCAEDVILVPLPLQYFPNSILHVRTLLTDTIPTPIFLSVCIPSIAFVLSSCLPIVSKSAKLLGEGIGVLTNSEAEILRERARIRRQWDFCEVARTLEELVPSDVASLQMDFVPEYSRFVDDEVERQYNVAAYRRYGYLPAQG